MPLRALNELLHGKGAHAGIMAPEFDRQSLVALDIVEPHSLIAVGETTADIAAEE